jgi:hypothetical protein
VSFLVDPPLLVASGAAIERLAPDERTKAGASAAVLGTFLVTSGALYANAPWIRWFWRACRAESGRDWMLNSGVFRFDHRNAGWPTHVLGVAIFATYPSWLRLGRLLGRARPATSGH